MVAKNLCVGENQCMGVAERPPWQALPFVAGVSEAQRRKQANLMVCAHQILSFRKEQGAEKSFQL